MSHLEATEIVPAVLPTNQPYSSVRHQFGYEIGLDGVVYVTFTQLEMVVCSCGHPDCTHEPIIKTIITRLIPCESDGHLLFSDFTTDDYEDANFCVHCERVTSAECGKRQVDCCTPCESTNE